MYYIYKIYKNYTSQIYDNYFIFILISFAINYHSELINEFEIFPF